MNRKIFFVVFMVLFSFIFSGCFSEKNSPFPNSQWIMQNYDNDSQLYYHHMILKADHSVMLRSSYADSSNIIVWRGTYKINDKKIIFNFEDCSRFENGKNEGQYNDKRLIKFYNGEYFYSLGLIGDEGNQIYHLQLIRPKNQIYGETKDIYGNYLEEFVKVPDGFIEYDE